MASCRPPCDEVWLFTACEHHAAPSSLFIDHVQQRHPLTRLHHASCRSVLAVCVALYLFDILTGLGEMSAVCLNAHLLLDKYQIYRSSPHPSHWPSTPPLNMLRSY